MPVLLLKDPQTARDYEVAYPQPVAYSEGAIYPLRMLPSREPLTAEIFGFLAKRAGARLYTGTVTKANVLTALAIAPLSDEAQGIFFGEMMEAGSQGRTEDIDDRPTPTLADLYEDIDKEIPKDKPAERPPAELPPAA